MPPSVVASSVATLPAPVFDDTITSKETPSLEKSLLVYSRRKKQVLDQNTLIDHPQSSNSSGDNDLSIDVPIALRKEQHIRHPIEKFVSYHALSCSFCTYFASVSSI